MKIKTKFLFSLTLIVALTGAMAVVAHRGITNISNQAGEIIDLDTPQLIALLQIKNTASDIETNLAEFGTIQGQQDSKVADSKSELLASLENLQNAQIDYQLHFDEGEEHADINVAVGIVITQASNLASAREQKLTASQIEPLEASLHQSVNTLKTSANHEIDNKIYHLNKHDTESDSYVERFLKLNEAMGIAVLLTVLLVGGLLARLIGRPLDKLHKGILAISKGDTTQKIPVYAHDEIGELATAFNDMNLKLQQSYHDLATQKAGVEREVIYRTKQLADEQARFIASINSLRLGFMLTDTQDHIIYSNPSLWKILDLHNKVNAPAEIQKQMDEMLHLHDLIVKCRTSKKPVDVSEITYANKILRILMSPVPSREQPGVIIGIVLLVEDITEAKVMERSKDEFFSIASHELRTPLTAIRGNTSMIKDFYADKFKDKDFDQMVGDIHSSSVRLIGIVNDFLDLSRIEQGKLEIKPLPFDISPVIEAVTYETAAVIQEKKLYLNIDHTLGTVPLVVGDSDRVKQIIYNLVGNAAKFTEKGGITIQAKPENDHLRVIISDTGRGIAPEQQNLLFHKFQQANAGLFTRDTTRGTGLGLYISMLLIQKMGGTIQLEHSEVDKGSAFSFTLPFADKNQPPQNPTAASKS